MGNGNGSKKSGPQLDREINDILTARQKREARERASAPRSHVASESEYERRERSDAQRKLAEVRRAPLSDRKEAQADFLKAMREYPEIVAERIGWLLVGNYGYGAKLLAAQVLGSPRMNRSAALTHMVGAFEWSSPEDMSIRAWKKLTKAEQARLETAVQGAIRRAEEREE